MFAVIRIKVVALFCMVLIAGCAESPSSFLNASKGRPLTLMAELEASSEPWLDCLPNLRKGKIKHQQAIEAVFHIRAGNVFQCESSDRIVQGRKVRMFAVLVRLERGEVIPVIDPQSVQSILQKESGIPFLRIRRDTYMFNSHPRMGASQVYTFELGGKTLAAAIVSYTVRLSRGASHHRTVLLVVDGDKKGLTDESIVTSLSFLALNFR